jgi:serine/threonine-protein kinase RsbW
VALFDEQPLKQSHLLVQTDLNDLRKVLGWFEQFNLPILHAYIWGQCQLALTEGFTNAVRHAHRDLPQTTPIDIEVKVFADRIEMRIWDQGPPFDFHAKLQWVRKHPPRLTDTGGRGMLWMQQLTDEVCYQRLPDQRNCLVMVKKIK